MIWYYHAMRALALALLVLAVAFAQAQGQQQPARPLAQPPQTQATQAPATQPEPRQVQGAAMENQANGASFPFRFALPPEAEQFIEEARRLQRNITLVEGFRSAKFGMTEAEVRAAIRRDFSQAADRIASEQTPVERTQVLSISVPNLIPDAGTARISYILGHQSKRLIQVTVLWGPPVDATVRSEALVNAAEALRAYFDSLYWGSGSVERGVSLADGSTLVFRALDEQGRMVQLQLMPAQAAKRSAANAQRAFALRLAYVADPLNPDVFRLQRGQF